MSRGAGLLTGLLLPGLIACTPVQSIELEVPEGSGKPSIAELWVEPAKPRDLFDGPGGRKLAPDPTLTFKVIEIKRGGFSDGYTVTGPDDREWSVKLAPEGHSEVTASRILWAVGYHQPPVYHVSRWKAEGGNMPNPQLPARFREKSPDFHGLDGEGPWSYYRNPFVGTTPLKGLLVLQALLGNNDLKDDNNELYELATAHEGARRWYVARDLGHTLGRPDVSGTREGDVERYEKAPFILGVDNKRIRFADRGRHAKLFEDISPADVRWICERLSRLSDAQWMDAFRAGGYPETDAERFIRRIKQHIAAGLALKG